MNLPFQSSSLWSKHRILRPNSVVQLSLIVTNSCGPHDLSPHASQTQICYVIFIIFFFQLEKTATFSVRTGLSELRRSKRRRRPPPPPPQSEIAHIFSNPSNKHCYQDQKIRAICAQYVNPSTPLRPPVMDQWPSPVGKSFRPPHSPPVPPCLITYTTAWTVCYNTGARKWRTAHLSIRQSMTVGYLIGNLAHAYHTSITEQQRKYKNIFLSLFLFTVIVRMPISTARKLCRQTSTIGCFSQLSWCAVLQQTFFDLQPIL